MPTQKIALLIGALILIVGAVIAVSQYLTPETAQVDYALTGLQDGSYAGPVPDVERDVQFSPTTSEDVRAVIRAKVGELQAKLKQVPHDGNVWMELALRYHSAGDYQGAKEVWEFLVASGPTNVTALGNLGRLHHFELKEFEKSEEYFRAAIEANPARPEAYYELFDLYRYSFKKDTSAAPDILKEAMPIFPDDYGLPAGLGIYYRDRGQSGLARTYFEQALTIARAQNNMNAVQSLGNELANLP